MDTLTERTRKRKPTSKQMLTAVEVIERMAGSTTASARSAALAPFVEDGIRTLHERLDMARLTEDRLLGTIANGLDADKRDKADHDIRLKSTKLGLELRGLLQRGNRNQVNVGIGGNAQVAVAVPWSPSPVLDDNSTVDSNSSITNERSIVPSTVTSTIEGTGSGRGAQGHGRYGKKSAAIVPVHEMSDAQLKKISKQLRDEEQRRRLVQRSKRNKRIGKHVGPNHQGRKRGGGCRSGKCGRCKECERRAKLRIPT